MSENNPRRIDRRTAEHLLSAAPHPEQATGSDPLSDLLAAAAAPAREGELAGEQAALAAFRDARLADAPQPRRESMLAKVLTVKVAVIAASVVAAGGVAVAAVTSSLPGQNGNSEHVSATSSSLSTSDQDRGPDKSGEHGKPTDKGKPETSEGKGNNGNGNNGNGSNGNGNGNASPSPSLVGLCNAYTAGEKSEHGKALENPAFSALITAAGGKENVDKFCADLLAVAKPDHQEGKPSKQPGGPNEDHPTGNDKNNGNGNGTPPSTHPGH
jgi:hypothetical protein